jgi:hypothetical protein
MSTFIIEAPFSMPAMAELRNFLLSEFKPLAVYSIFPNPASEFFTLRTFVEWPFKLSVVITDALGSVQGSMEWKPEMKQFLVPISNLASGVYSIQILNGDSLVFTQKLLVQNQ